MLQKEQEYIKRGTVTTTMYLFIFQLSRSQVKGTETPNIVRNTRISKG